MAPCRGHLDFCLRCPREHLLPQTEGKQSRRHNFYWHFQDQVYVSCTQAVLKIIRHIDVDSGHRKGSPSASQTPAKLFPPAVYPLPNTTKRQKERQVMEEIARCRWSMWGL